MSEESIKAEIFDFLEEQGKLQEEIKRIEVQKRDKLIELQGLRNNEATD